MSDLGESWMFSTNRQQWSTEIAAAKLCMLQFSHMDSNGAVAGIESLGIQYLLMCISNSSWDEFLWVNLPENSNHQFYYAIEKLITVIYLSDLPSFGNHVWKDRMSTDGIMICIGLCGIRWPSMCSLLCFRQAEYTYITIFLTKFKKP